jgi:DNA-directed RNA polymerase specialized sigma subunit
MAKRLEEIRLTDEQRVLAEANLNLARDIAWSYKRSSGIGYRTLESAAFEGLCAAASRYNPELINKATNRPMKFSSLAVPYIRGAILHYIRDKTYSMRLTHRMRELWVKGKKLLNRGMSDLEISKALEIDIKEWQDTKSACSGPPLELKDQAKPTDALEPDEVDMLSAYEHQAQDLLDRMPEVLRARLERFCANRAKTQEPSKTLKAGLDSLVDGA